MINTNHFIEKLDTLKEYLYLKINYPPKMIWINLQVCPDEYYIKNHKPIPIPYQEKCYFGIPKTFDEYLKMKLV